MNDYGAPVGFRLAVRHPDRITGIITQNGNAYEDGLTSFWSDLRKIWSNPSEADLAPLRANLTREATHWQYTDGVPDVSLVNPDKEALDQALLDRPGNEEIQLALFLNYATNVAAYPVWQEYLRTHQPPVLAVWGKNDAIFGPDGATAFTRDVKNAQVHLLDTGHFALETHRPAIAALTRTFLHSLPA